MTKDENKPIHDIHYLPPINQSTTKFDTVQEMLVQVKEKASALGLLATDLVLDHANFIVAQPEKCRTGRLHQPSNG